MEALNSHDVPPETQEQILDEARAETDRAISTGWEPASVGDVLSFQIERAAQVREAGWDPNKIAWDLHGPVLRGEHVPDQAARLAVQRSDERHSWKPVDLLEFADSPPEPPVISGLAYPGRRHVYSGEPETLKTWAADILCVEQIRAGHEVVYVDFEMGAREQAFRLRSLGLTEAELERFLYVAPTEPLTSVLPDFEAFLGVVKPTLVVLDAFTGALELHGADPNSGVEVERFYRTVIAPIQRYGAAVVLLDHVTKNRETRGKYSIGTERKLGGADVHLGFEIVRPFGRGRSGLATIKTHKDRPGQLPRPRAAELELHSDADSGAVSWAWRVPADENASQRFRPTMLMERVSLFVSAHGSVRPSRHAIEQGVKGKTDYVREAIEILILEGYLVEEEGERGARLLRSERPFREHDEVAA